VTSYSADQCRTLYLELLKRSLLGLTHEDGSTALPSAIGEQARKGAHNRALRQIGADWPLHAPTMIGMERINNLQQCVERVIADGVPGDLIETGVWRGGSCIFMRGVLKAHGVSDRTVWVADSFEGLPPPNAEKYPHDTGLHLEQYKELAVSIDEVKKNFERYDLLDDQVRFLKGWFRDSLPKAPIERLAVLRLDGDLYESTADALTNLYDRLSPGGFVIVDDYAIPACKQAVQDFRAARGIDDPIEQIDWTGVFWRRR
jgi:O-methyltransferase